MTWEEEEEGEDEEEEEEGEDRGGCSTGARLAMYGGLGESSVEGVFRIES